jgi:hypothetical protein
MAAGQRGWKWQPAGGANGDGSSPLTGAKRRFFVSSRGALASSAGV